MKDRTPRLAFGESPLTPLIKGGIKGGILFVGRGLHAPPPCLRQDYGGQVSASRRLRRDALQRSPIVLYFSMKPDNVPFHKFIGAKFLKVKKGYAKVSLPVKKEFLQGEGVVQGGIIAGLLDMTSVYTVYPFIEKDEKFTSIEFKINFFAPVSRGTILAKARTIKRGRTIVVAESSAYCGKTLVAKGIFSYLVYRPAKSQARLLRAGRLKSLKS